MRASTITPRRSVFPGVLLGLLLALCAWPTISRGQGDTIWELTAYRIGLAIACDPQTGLSPQWQQDLAEFLIEQAGQQVGAAWQLESITPTAPLRHAMLASLDEITWEQLPEGLGEYDKIFLLRIAGGSSGFQLETVEVDARTRLTGTPARRHLSHVSLVDSQAFATLLEAFAPLARIEDTEADVATLRLRAAALPPRDPSLAPLALGGLMRTVIRYNDREGDGARIRPVDWTYLRVESIDGARVQAKIYSALRSPLSGRRRGRVEPLALMTRPPGGSTRLVIETSGETPKPLAGYDVFAYAPDDPATNLVGRSDAMGHVDIEALQDTPLRILLVRHGTAPLARLPMIPGLQAEMTAPLPDDDARLEAEAIVTAVQEQLIDQLAMRKLLARRVQLLIDEGKTDEARTLLGDAREFITPQELNRVLSQAQRELVVADPRMQQRIDTLFTETRKIVSQFLTSSELDELQRSLNRPAATAGRPESAGRAN